LYFDNKKPKNSKKRIKDILIIASTTRVDKRKKERQEKL
jgi:hypothetical protein